jgi:flagellar export protein FliJ
VSGVFKYRLQSLLEKKIEWKEEAERTVAERKGALDSEKARLEELRGKQQALVDRKEQARRSALDGQFAFLQDYLRGLSQDIEDAKDAVFSQRYAVEEAEENLDQARRELAERTREVEVLKKHRERSEIRWRREAERKEELENEEIGAAMYQVRRSAETQRS